MLTYVCVCVYWHLPAHAASNTCLVLDIRGPYKHYLPSDLKRRSANRSSVFTATQHTLLTAVVVDYTGKFRWVGPGRPGAMQDRQHYNDSDLGKRPNHFFSVVRLPDGREVREGLMGDNIYLGHGRAAPVPFPHASKHARSELSEFPLTVVSCFHSDVIACIKKSKIRGVADLEERRKMQVFNTLHYGDRVVVEHSIGRLVRSQVPFNVTRDLYVITNSCARSLFLLTGSRYSKRCGTCATPTRSGAERTYSSTK